MAAVSLGLRRDSEGVKVICQYAAPGVACALKCSCAWAGGLETSVLYPRPQLYSGSIHVKVFPLLFREPEQLREIILTWSLLTSLPGPGDSK